MRSHVVCRQPTYCGTVLPATHAQLRQRSACWCAGDIELQLGKSSVGAPDDSSHRMQQSCNCAGQALLHVNWQAHMRTSPVREASALGRTAWNAYAYNVSYRTGDGHSSMYSGHALWCSCNATGKAELRASFERASSDARGPKVSACCHRSAHRRQECGRQLQRTDGL